jgi:hypothetical protein
MVFITYTIANPETVVIKALDTRLAFMAMLATIWYCYIVAFFTYKFLWLLWF